MTNPDLKGHSSFTHLRSTHSSILSEKRKQALNNIIISAENKLQFNEGPFNSKQSPKRSNPNGIVSEFMNSMFSDNQWTEVASAKQREKVVTLVSEYYGMQSNFSMSTS